MLSPRREQIAFAVLLAALVTGFLGESLVGGKVLSPADVLFASKSFAEFRGPDYEPKNRLLIDPVLQFQPWLEFNRAMLRRGRLPLWNSLAGCGTPHLANGQSAVFDPFHLIAYLGTLPQALAWMAAARLWVAGMGMFLLARRWGLGPWGRLFAGLVYPFSGFLIVWLLFPVTSVAVWMPWLLLATESVLERPRARTLSGLAVVTGFVLLGGHIQTSAHVLLVSGAYALWRFGHDSAALPRVSTRALAGWSAGLALGVALAAIEIIPLGSYLCRSPVWADRAEARPSWWSVGSPRLLDSLCTALPYAYGSQRRGHPNLAKAVGVHNLNESAGGFVGLPTLLWLVPLGVASWRSRPLVRFLSVLVLVGFLGAFEIPPVANVLRVIPALNVMDHRRLTLWVAFGLALLGGIGLDRLHAMSAARGWGRLVGLWLIAAFGLIVVAASVRLAEPILRDKARDHYARAAATTPGADRSLYARRAERQVAHTVDFVPRYALLVSGNLLALAALATALRKGRLAPGASDSRYWA